jgi:hypothetical protein
MTYEAIKLEDQIDVIYCDRTVRAKVRRIGFIQGNGWVMLTLDIDGKVCYVPAREKEIASPVKPPNASRDEA